MAEAPVSKTTRIYEKVVEKLKEENERLKARLAAEKTIDL